MKKLSELKDLSVDDLRAQEHELADELFRLRLKRAAGQLANPMRPRQVRRTLARVKTLLHERAAAPGRTA